MVGTAQIYDTNNPVVQTLAGSGFIGYLDGQGTQTMFNYPSKIVSDTYSNLFVVEFYSYVVRKISPDATVTPFAGGGSSPLPGYGTNVSIGSYAPFLSAAIDRSNAIWITTSSGYLLRVGSDGYVTKTNMAAFSSQGAVCVDSTNNIYMTAGNKIYRWRTNGVMEVFAGSGNPGSLDGNGELCSFLNPTALTVDSADNLYVWDSANHLIRRINQNRDVETISGAQSADEDGLGRDADFNTVSALCTDGLGNIYLACETSIRRISIQTNVTTVAGNFSTSGYTNGAGNIARFNQARGICFSGGNLYVTDTANQRIRSISFNPAPQQVSPANLRLSILAGLDISGTVGRIYRVESSANTVTWTQRTTLLLPRSPYRWIDEKPVSGHQFYRAFLLP